MEKDEAGQASSLESFFFAAENSDCMMKRK